MKRLVLMIALFAIGACKTEPVPPQVNVEASRPVVVPQTSPPTVVTIDPKVMIDDLKKSIDALKEEIAESNKERQDAIAKLIRDATAPVAGLQTSVGNIRTELTVLQEKYATEYRVQIQRLETLEKEQSAISTRQEELKSAQTSNIDRLDKENQRLTELIERAVTNSDLAIIALNSIGDRKVNKVFGLGGRELLSDEMQNRLRGRAQASGLAIVVK